MSLFTSRSRVFLSSAFVLLTVTSLATIACSNSSDDGSGANCNPNDDVEPVMKVTLTSGNDGSPITTENVTFTSGISTLAATCEDNDAADGCDGTWYVTVDVTQPSVAVVADGYQASGFGFKTTTDSCGSTLVTFTTSLSLTPSNQAGFAADGG